MHPPAHTCKALAEYNPNIRLCWIGEMPDAPEGCFGVLEFRPKARVGKTLEPQYPEDIEHAGPIFSAKGDTVPDWNSATHAPVLVFTCSSSWKLSAADVFGTRLVNLLQRARKTRKEHEAQKREELVEQGKRRAEMKDELVDAFTDRLVWVRNQTDGERIVTPYKFWKEEQRRKSARQRARVGLENVELERRGML